jgi:hypothetical protein
VRLGDLIDWTGRRWIVRRHERPTRTAILHDGERTTEIVPDDLDTTKPDECQVVCNPSDDWPFVAIAQRPKLGRLVRIARPQGASGETIDLVLFRDWVVADPTQPGGALFFSPMLNLRLGDTLLAVYEKGRARIQIPREFLSTAEKMARAAAPPPEAPRISVYDRLRRNEFADDDD